MNNMLKDKRMMIIIVLVIGIMGLSIGLSAFSSTLNIKAGTTVSPSRDNFKLELSCVRDKTDECEITPTSDTPGLVEKASKAVVVNSGDSLIVKNLSFYFTEPGQKMRYTFYVRNTGNLDVYMKNFGLKNVEGTNKAIKCTAGEGTSQKLVDEFCEYDQRGFRYEFDAIGMAHLSTLFDSFESKGVENSMILANSTAWNSSNDIFIELTYTGNNVRRVDGPMTVEIGDFYINLSTVPNG